MKARSFAQLTQISSEHWATADEMIDRHRSIPKELEMYIHSDCVPDEVTNYITHLERGMRKAVKNGDYPKVNHLLGQVTNVDCADWVSGFPKKHFHL